MVWQLAGVWRSFFIAWEITSLSAPTSLPSLCPTPQGPIPLLFSPTNASGEDATRPDQVISRELVCRLCEFGNFRYLSWFVGGRLR